jgi:23S rRNA pseudouridine955/2504/2580 synthase
MSIETRAVSGDEADIRLDRWFRRHFPQATQGLVQRLCRTGQIRIDGRRAGADTRLLPGQSVRIPPLPPPTAPQPVHTPPSAETAAEVANMVLYQDSDLFVLNKPPGLPTQGGPGIKRHLDAMLDALRDGAADRPRLVHRLDRDTSGVLVVARTPGVAAKLAAALRTRTVEKVYWAVVAGRPVPVAGRIERDLVRVDGFRGERAAVAGPYDKDTAHSITDYQTLEHAGRKFAWLELRPLTGRTHQLRVHCAALGAPILGDAPYGIEREGRNTALAEGFADTLHLLARRIVLPHPAGGSLAVEAPLPAHMAATFATFGFSAADPAAPERRR